MDFSTHPELSKGGAAAGDDAAEGCFGFRGRFVAGASSDSESLMERFEADLSWTGSSSLISNTGSGCSKLLEQRMSISRMGPSTSCES
jgi:hypothetical protein